MLGVTTTSGTSSNGYAASGSTLSWSHTITGTNRLLVVTIQLWQDVAGTGSVSSLTYNGTALTLATSRTQTSMRTEIWYLIAPDIGTHTVLATITGATDDRKGGSVAFTGAHQTSPINASNTATGSSSPITVDVTTTVANCIVVDSAINYSTAALTIGAGQINVYNSNSGTSSGATSFESKATTGAVTMSWTKTGTDDWATAGIAIRPAEDTTSALRDSYPYYQYLVYSGSTMMGQLKNVVSEFSYSHQINQAGTQLKVTLGYNFDDIGASEDFNYIVDSSSNNVVSENGDYVIADTNYVFANQPINLGYRVMAYKFDEYHLNGIKVFDGIISSWVTDYNSSVVELTILSHGVYLDQYLINTETDLAVSQLVSDTEVTMASAAGPTAPDYYAQTFQIGTASNITSISAYIRKTDVTKLCMVDLQLVEGTPSSPGAVLGTVTGRVIDNITAQFVDFTFASPISILASTTYYFVLNSASGATIYWESPKISYNSTSLYASGQVYDNLAGAGWVARTRDLAFKVNTTSGSTAGNFLNAEPGYLAKTALDIFNSQGGLISYTSNTIQSSSISVDYTFKLGTIWEALKKAYELSDSNYTMYINPADNLTYLKALSATPDHVFIKGKHITALKIEQTIEGMVNTVYFSGGDTGSGENLYMTDSNTYSQSLYGQWLERASDNRVTQSDTAEVIMASKISRGSYPFFRISTAVQTNSYDLESINLGDMISFAGFNNLIDGLLVAVVGLKHSSNEVELQLGQVLPRQSQRVEKLQRDLISQQTVNNPESTS